MKKKVNGIKAFCLIPVLFAFLSSIQSQFVRIDCNGFDLNDSQYKPLVVNYAISFITDDFGDYFIEPNSNVSRLYSGSMPVFDYNTYPNENKNYTSARAKLLNDLNRIKNDGFNTIRLIGAGSIISSGNIDIPVPSSGGGYTKYYSLLTQFFSDANAEGLKVIMLTAGNDQWKVNDQYKTYLENFAGQFKDDTTIMAYDLYNEPEYALAASSENDKFNFTKLISDWSYAIKRNDPNHLVTIGLNAPEVSGYDPSLLPIDFVSFHLYAQDDDVNITLDKMKALYYWASKTMTMPWIIGETGYSATSGTDAATYPTVGTLNDQKTFVDHTMQISLDCNCKGYSYWKYQESSWGLNNPADEAGEAHLGLYWMFGEGPPLYSWGGGLGSYALNLASETNNLKPAVESFKNYASLIKGTCSQPSNYFTTYNGTATSGGLADFQGTVKDDKGNPIANACVIGIEKWNNGARFLTFTDVNGNFTLKSDGAPMPLLKISYPGYSTIVYDATITWAGWPSPNAIHTLQKVNNKSWTKEWTNGNNGKITTANANTDWILSTFDKFYKGNFNGDGLQDLLCIKGPPEPGENISNDAPERMVVLIYKNPLTINPYSAGWEILWDIQTDLIGVADFMITETAS